MNKGLQKDSVTRYVWFGSGWRAQAVQAGQSEEWNYRSMDTFVESNQGNQDRVRDETRMALISRKQVNLILNY